MRAIMLVLSQNQVSKSDTKRGTQQALCATFLQPWPQCWVLPESVPLWQLSMVQHLSQTLTSNDWQILQTLANPIRSESNREAAVLHSSCNALPPASAILHDRHCLKMVITAICLAYDLLYLCILGARESTVQDTSGLRPAASFPGEKYWNTLHLTCSSVQLHRPTALPDELAGRCPLPAEIKQCSLPLQETAHSCTHTSHTSVRTFVLNFPFFFLGEIVAILNEDKKHQVCPAAPVITSSFMQKNKQFFNKRATACAIPVMGLLVRKV